MHIRCPYFLVVEIKNEHRMSVFESQRVGFTLFLGGVGPLEPQPTFFGRKESRQRKQSRPILLCRASYRLKLVLAAERRPILFMPTSDFGGRNFWPERSAPSKSDVELLQNRC